MALSLFTKTKKAIVERARDDYATKMRLKYKPYYHAMESQQGTRIRLDGRDMIMLSSNDYLGLSFHPKTIEACGAAAKIWGTSTTGARISNGSRAYHTALEEKLAAFIGREACHISVAGYISCCSAVASFAQKGDVILADKNIHSCLVDATRLSMATVERFSHNNPEDLRQWRLPRGRHGLPRELVERSQRERLLAAVVRVTVEKGYESTTVGDILVEAGVGRESFYELFDDKLDCMVAAHKILLDDLEQRIRAVYIGDDPWPARVREGLAVTLDWFGADPEAARFLLVEMSTVGPAFRSLFKREYARFIQMLDDGFDDSTPGPELTEATSLGVGALLARIYEEILLERVSDLPRLLPDLTYDFLVPFVGEEVAREQQQLATATS